MIKIAFFDIDGTLLKMGHRELTEKTAKALNSLRQKGILLCMATGRGSLSIPAFQDVTFDVLLTFNGSYVTIGEKIIFKNPLNHLEMKYSQLQIILMSYVRTIFIR